MTLLESGPAKTDRLYWLIVGIVFLGFAGYFVYDGAVGYRKKNIQEANRRLAVWTDVPVQLGEKPTEEDFKRAREARVTTRQQLHEFLGEPLPPKKGPAPPAEDVERFASVYGLATVPVDRFGRVGSEQRWAWQKWYKSKEEIEHQFYWAIIPAVASLYFFYRCHRAWRLRAVIDDEGMTYGNERIAFADMVSLRDYNRKGWVDLYYRAGGQEKRLRIDNQKIAKFDEIIELICRKCGFENPVKAYHEAREASPQDAPEQDPDSA